MGHEGCCGECATKLETVAKQVDEVHKLLFQLAESMSALGESPMARGMMRSMGIKVPAKATTGAESK
jgi:hypothetical protein